MANIKSMLKGFVVIALVVASLLTLVTMASADNGKREDGSGKYGQWSAQWWQWILEQPATGNPIFDQSGADASTGQPRKDVFFLAGAFGGTVTRNITVPAGTGLFLPLVNSGGFGPKPAPQPKPNTNQVPQLRTLYAAPFIDNVSELHVTLDNVSLLGSVRRVKSPVYQFTFPDVDNVYQFLGIDITGTYTAVDDGYWLYIAPLPKGTYVLNFGGSTSDGFSVDVTDTITVQ